MNAIQLIIELKSSLLVASTHYGDENSRISLDYIPGSTIKGAVIYQFIKQNPFTDQDIYSKDATFRKYFFDDQVIFLNAYPYQSTFFNHPRSIPVPFSWQTEKHNLEEQNNNRGVYDFALDIVDLNQAKAEPRKFFWQAPEGMGDGKIRYPLISPKMVSTVHNMSVHPHIKNPESSTVFRYDVIAPRQVFCSYILCKDEDLTKAIEPFIPTGSVFLGGSRNARYGHTHITKVEVENWEEFESQADGTEDEIIITLLSDMILKNSSGEPSFDFSLALQNHLKMTTKPKPVRAFIKTGIAGGFNRKWGLPIIQDPVILKGSCFVYRKNEFSNLNTLTYDTRWGLGERIADGFGRIGINLVSIASFRTYVPSIEIPETAAASSESEYLIKRFIEKTIQERINQKLLSYLEEVVSTKPPENNQLNKIRILAKQAIRSPLDQNLEIKHFFQNKNIKEDAFLQFDRRFLNIKGERYTWRAWIIKLIQEADGFTQLAFGNPDYQVLGETYNPDQAKKAEVAYQMIEAVAAKVIKDKE
jgi:CRISPR-associated protein Csx10